MGIKPYSLLSLIPITLWWGLLFNEVVCSEKCISKLITLGCIEISYLNWAVTVIQNECTKHPSKCKWMRHVLLLCFVLLLCCFFGLFGFFLVILVASHWLLVDKNKPLVSAWRPVQLKKFLTYFPLLKEPVLIAFMNKSASSARIFPGKASS